MDRRPIAILLKFPGTHCDRETARALELAGFDAEIVPFSAFEAHHLSDADLAVLPGGFSYGDRDGAGVLAGTAFRDRLHGTLRRFRDRGGLVLGICNGFQILTELGLLPDGTWHNNDSERFVCRWVEVKRDADNPVYLSELPERFELPVAHEQGRFVAEALPSNAVALRYVDNPNGTPGDVAALQDETGRVLGIMPHPERYMHPEEHYAPDQLSPAGLLFFRSIARWLQHTDRPIREKCGVFATFKNPAAAREVRTGLIHLQHRGQESAGILTGSPDGPFQHLRGPGTVAKVFDASTDDELAGSMGIGHVRYSTSGAPGAGDAQPLIARNRPLVGIAHNGTVTAAPRLRDDLRRRGVRFDSLCDTEVLLRRIEAVADADPVEMIRRGLRGVPGAYSLVLQFEGGVAAARDPQGFRPLLYGRRHSAGEIRHYFASETCALDAVGADHIEEIPSGGGVYVGAEGVRRFRIEERRTESFCVFEKIYFSSPDSRYDGEAVRRFRERLGARLASEAPAEADVVAYVPRTAEHAARGFASASDLPLVEALRTTDGSGRSFIAPDPASRRRRVRDKFAACADTIRHRRVALVDDSLVRGTTMSHVVELLRRAGAAEIHVRVASPPLIHPCFYGVDMPRIDEFLLRRVSQSELPDHLGADSTAFLSRTALLEEAGHQTCRACFDGVYPTATTAAPQPRQQRCSPTENPASIADANREYSAESSDCAPRRE